MATTLESARAVRAKATNAVRRIANGTSQGDGDPSLRAALEAFFLNWAMNKGNLDLQFIPFDATSAVAVDGQDFGVDAAHRVYFVYVKKTNTGTDTWFRLIDEADNDSEVIGDVRLEQALTLAKDQAIAWYPNGMAMTNGLVATFTTTPGDTATQSSSADAGNGFVIIGAP